MADFTHNAWGWFIAVTTVFSIVVLIYFVWKFSTRRPDDQGDNVETTGHIWDEDLAEYNNPLPRWWLNLFYITLFWGIGYLVLYPGLGAYEGILNWSQTHQYEGEITAANEQYGPLFAQYAAIPIPELVKNPQAVTVGERLFSAYCTTCHGSDARGARGFPNLRDDDWLYGGEPAQIVASISNGRSGLMPAWGELLSEDDLRAAAYYVEHLAGRSIDRRAVEQGKRVYNTNCVVCHGADGGGNQQLGAPGLSDDIWVYGGSTRKIIESIEKGRNGIMPPHESFLGPDKIHLIAAYIYQFRNQ